MQRVGKDDERVFVIDCRDPSFLGTLSTLQLLFASISYIFFPI